MYVLICREIAEDGKELYFDHGAPYFSTSNADVEEVIKTWEARGLVAEWKQNLGSFDFITKKIVNIEKVYFFLIIVYYCY